MELHDYLHASWARVRGWRERRYKAAPWERPNKPDPDALVRRWRERKERQQIQAATTIYEWGTVINGVDPDEMQLAHAPIVTGRVDKITGTIEIGGKAQGWRLSGNGNHVKLHVHKSRVFWYGFNIDSGWIELPNKDIQFHRLPGNLSPDPNFTPPGQYVEANGLKFWVEQGLAGMGIFMNNIPLFSIENDINQIYITPPVRKLTGANQFYPYTGCHCDTCGGGE